MHDPQVADAHSLTGPSFQVSKKWKGERRENGNDDRDDQQLNECEGGLGSVAIEVGLHKKERRVLGGALK